MSQAVDVLQLLSAAYSGSKEERTQATAQLEEAFNSPAAPQHLLTLVRAGLNPSLPPEQSLSALLYAKNSLLHNIPDEVLSGNPAVLTELETLLFNGVFTVPESHRRIICACTMTLISGFEWNYLPQLMPIVINESSALRAQLQGAAAQPPADVAERSLAALEMLHTYTQRFRTPGLEPLPMKLEVSAALVPALPVFLELNDFRVSRAVFKVMECVTETALQLSTEKDMPKSALDDWFAAMAAFPEKYYQAAFAAGGKAYEEYVKCVKRVAMITFSVLSDATRRKKPAPVARHFVKNKMAQRFLEVWRQWLQSCVASYAGGDSSLAATHKDSEMFAIRYLKMCTLDEALYKEHLRPNALSIIEHLLFPYLRYGEEDDEIFNDEDNLSEYVQYMMEEGFGNAEFSQRQAASNTILALIGGKKAFHDSATLLQEVLQVLTTGLALETNEANFPNLFGFLQLLSILRKYLRQIPEIWNGQMAQVLMQYVAPRLHADVPFVALRCKAVVVCQRYSKVPMPSENDFAAFVQMMCALVQDKDARIRLAGVDAMCTLLEMKRARHYLVPVLVPLMEECMGFLHRVQTTFVPTVILHLTTHFAPELTSVMGKLGSTLVQHFLATAFDMQNQEMNFTGGEEDISHFERAAFSADALLDTIYTVVLSSSENKDAFVAMRPDLIRLIRAILENPDSFEFMDKTLCIYLHVVHFSGKEMPQELWDCLPLVFQSVNSGIGVDFFNTIEEVLDNYMSCDPVAYFSNQAVMEATLDVCTKMLVGGTVCEAECRMAPAQLFEAMLHQGKAYAGPNGPLNPYLPRIVGLLLHSLVHPDVLSCEDIRVRLWIIAALMDCFFYDARLTLRIMSGMGALGQFLDGLFHFFRGCIPECDTASGAAAALASSNSSGGGKKKKGRKSAKKKSPEDEAQDVVDNLTILLRKVVILGLSSILGTLADPSCAADAELAQCQTVFAQQYEAKAVALVQYCVFANEEKYTARCKVSEENLVRIRSGEAGEEDVEDVDLGDEDVLGHDGGDDTVGLAADEAAYEDLSDVDDWDEGDELGGGLAGAAPEDGDDYESPIDDINEVHYFTQWVSLAAQQQQQHPGLTVLRPEADYANAGTVAGRYRELCKELEAAMEEDFKRRSEQAAAAH